MPRFARTQRECDRDRQQEGPAPAELAQQAARDESEREAARARGGVDAERAVALRPFGETRGDDREPGRRRERGGGSLEEARYDEQRAVADDAAKRGREREHGERDQEYSPAAEEIGSAPAEQ